MIFKLKLLENIEEWIEKKKINKKRRKKRIIIIKIKFKYQRDNEN